MPLDKTLAAAIGKRDNALAELGRWDAFIAAYEELMGSDVAPSVEPEVKIGSVRRTRKSASPELEQEASEICQEVGRPIPTKEMLQLLTERGLRVWGKDPLANLAARLSRSGNFVIERGIGWRLKEPRQGYETVSPNLEGEEPTVSRAPNYADRRGGGGG